MKTREPNDKTKAQLLAAVIKTRTTRGLSVNQAAQMASITQPTWSRIESGEIAPQYGTLFDMADAVGLMVVVSF